MIGDELMRTTTLLVFTCVVFLACSSAVVADDSAPTKDEPGNSQSKFSVTLANGLSVQAVGYSIRGDYVYLQYPSGAQSMFKKEDIDLSSLPPRSASNEVSVSVRSTKPAEPTEQDRKTYDSLRDAAGKIRLKTDVLKINQEHLPGMSIKAPSSSEYPNWEERRAETLEGFRATIAPYARTAAELSTKMKNYYHSCRGSTTTYHEGTTSGAGIREGTGSIGPYGFSYEEFSTWGGQYQGTSTTYHADTPYCNGLASEIRSSYGFVRPVIESAATYAFLTATVVESDLDLILVSYGIAPVKSWVR